MNGYKGIVVCGIRPMRPLVHRVCRHIDVKPTGIGNVDFSNGNMKVVIDGNVRSHDVFVFGSGAQGGLDNRMYDPKRGDLRDRVLTIIRDALTKAGLESYQLDLVLNWVNMVASLDDLSSLVMNRDLVEYLITIHALRSSSAGRITAVMPYMPYVRSDKKDEGRISVTAKLVSQLVELCGANRALVMDLHKPQIQEFFNIPCDQMFAEPLFFEWIRANQITNYSVVTADEGNLKSARRIAKLLGDSQVFIARKERVDDTENAQLIGIDGAQNVAGTTCLVFDDEGLSMGTMCGDAEDLKKQNPKEIIGFLSHNICSNGAAARVMNSPIDRMVTTDTVPFNGRVLPSKFEVLSTAVIFARALNRIHRDESVSKLIDELRELSLAGKPLIG